MTGYQSKKAAAQAKLDEDDDTQVYDDALTIVYQSGYYDGKKAAQPVQEPAFWLNEQGQLLATRGDAERRSIGQKIIPLYTTPPAQPAQEPVGGMREVFEKWAKALPNYMDITRFEAGYSDCNTDSAWAGWQASLAQPEQEPVGKFAKFTDGIWREVTDGSPGVSLYTATQRTWVDLTDEQIFALFDTTNVYGSKWVEFARAVEAKLREKNT